MKDIPASTDCADTVSRIVKIEPPTTDSSYCPLCGAPIEVDKRKHHMVVKTDCTE